MGGGDGEMETAVLEQHKKTFFLTQKIKNMNNKRQQIPIVAYLSTIDSKKQSKQAEQNRNLGYRECFDGCQVGGGRGMGEKR